MVAPKYLWTREDYEEYYREMSQNQNIYLYDPTFEVPPIINLESVRHVVIDINRNNQFQIIRQQRSTTMNERS